MDAKVDYISNSITTNNQKEIKDILWKSNTNFNELKEEIKENLDFSQIFKIIYNKLGPERKTKSAEEVKKVPWMVFIIQAMIDLLDDYSGHQKVYNNMTLGEMLKAWWSIDNINGKKTKEIIRILQNCFNLPETWLVNGKLLDEILSWKIDTDSDPNNPTYIKSYVKLSYKNQNQQDKRYIKTVKKIEIAEIPESYTDGEEPLPYNEKEGKVETWYEVLKAEGIEYFDLWKHETPNGINTYHRFIEKVKEGWVDRKIASANIHICVGTDAVPCRPWITKHNQKNYEKKRDSIISLLGTSQIDNKKDIITFLTDPSPKRLSTTDKNGNTFANNWLAWERFLEAVGDAIRAFQHQKGMKINFFFEKNWSRAWQTHDKRNERYVTTYMDGFVEKTNPWDPIVEKLKKKRIIEPLPKYWEIWILAQEQRDGREVIGDTSKFPIISFKTADWYADLGSITIDTTTWYVTNINGSRIHVSYNPPKQIIIYFQ